MKKLLVVFLLVLLSLPFILCSGPLEIKQITIQGNKLISNQRILLLLKSRTGTEFSEKVFQEDLGRLGKTEFFSDFTGNAEKRDDGVYINISLKENPIIGKVVFEGNRRIKTKNLRKLIGIEAGEIFQPDKIKAELKKIDDYYTKKGLFFTQSSYRTEKKGNEVFLMISVKEGSKAYVEKIIFSGNNSFSQGSLRKLMKIKQRKMPFLRGTFKPEIYKEDIENIKSFYRDNGYLDVAVAAAPVEVEKKRLVLGINVSEGKQSLLGSIAMKGDLLAPEKELRNLLTMKEKGEIFNEDKAVKNVQSLRGFYFDRGYIECEVDVIPRQGAEQREIDIEYLIKPGEVFYVNDVNIEGNTRTKDKVIRRQIRLLPEDKFSGKQIRKTFNNLRDLNYFKEIDIRPEPVVNEPNKANLVVDVEEREKTGIFMFGGGFSSLEKIIGFVSLEQPNFDIKNWPTFTGGGQDFRIWLQIGSVTKGYNISFTEPYFLDRPIWIGPDIFDFTNSWDEYKLRRRGGDIRFGRKWEDKLSLGFKLSLETLKLSEVEVVDPSATAGTKQKRSLAATFEWITLDSVRYPTRGQRFSCEVEYAGDIFQGDIAFLKTQIEENYFHPVKKCTFHSKTKLGVMTELDGKVIPIYEKFFGGGIGTVRGYEERSLGQKDVNGYPLGGEVIFAQNFELIYPVYKDVLKAVVFFDIGNVWTKWGDIGKLKKGVGPGLRIQIPFLSTPIRIDYGIALDKDPGESRGRLHFGMSFGF